MTKRRRSRSYFVRARYAARSTRISGICVAALFLLLAQTASAQVGLASGDDAWNSRADGLTDGRAKHGRIEVAIKSYRQALEKESAKIEAQWKLLRALHYLIEFTDAPDGRKQSAVEEAVVVASTGIRESVNGNGESRDHAALLFWSAIAWGARGQRVGLLTIVREGVANKMHEYAHRAVELEPEIERGGGYRLLSRLHATLPRLPFISGWVDRGKTLAMAERAFSIDSADPGNRLILALALTEHAPERLEEARLLVESVANATPRPTLLAEDLAIREPAREQLRQ